MHIKNSFFKTFALLTAICVVGRVGAATPQNSRAAVNSNVAPARAEGRQVARGASSEDKNNVVVSRSAMSRPSTTAARSGAIINSARVLARAATPVARGARSAAVVSARNATNTNRSNVSRAAMSRATAIFDDVSKIGGGYAQCREAYATCMDQFCAKANDTYRRCFCSARFTEFRDTEDALDQARLLLQQFEDNNLNAVDKTAAEVDAMYSATVGEAAIKNDTSGAAKLLAEIGDLISGKKKATRINSSSSLGVLSLDFSSDVGDVFGGGDVFSNSSSIFDGASGVDLTTLEGEDLFNHVHRQCMSMVADSCNGNAVANMAKSAYGIMISQDCNAYEKSVNAKRQQVQNTVRQAEKILREARLEEYRAHNSQDVNECLDKVRSAMLADTACGANYKRCLDYTGAYINQSTGDAIYTPRLFELENLILLEGAPSSSVADSVANANTDILSMNAGFNTFLDSRKMFATTALDTCRDKADLVWNEFKRAAIIEIAQAQDEKIEEVKNTCVETMRDCYDTQSNALKSFDNNTAQETGAISAYAARQMCADKVTACAALYSKGGDACNFDGNGKLIAGEGGDTAGRCGLTALLSFVDTVDTVRIAEGCETAITTHLEKLCTPTSGDMGYPWNCRLMSLGDITAEMPAENTLAANIAKYVKDYCVGGTTDVGLENLDDRTKDQMNRAFNDIKDELTEQLIEVCEDLTGTWVYPAQFNDLKNTQELAAFKTSVFGGNENPNEDAVGKCVESTVRVACLSFNTDSENPVATYDEKTDTCTFTTVWYENQCNLIGGTWMDNACYY
ncbi:MAG: hypothetical protein J6L70_02015 [Alphaproteobacteria bacterium]|nr:hypothetical protein [Alphaproteobacteria bacterium]